MPAVFASVISLTPAMMNGAMPAASRAKPSSGGSTTKAQTKAASSPQAKPMPTPRIAVSGDGAEANRQQNTQARIAALGPLGQAVAIQKALTASRAATPRTPAATAVSGS